MIRSSLFARAVCASAVGLGLLVPAAPNAAAASTLAVSGVSPSAGLATIHPTSSAPPVNTAADDIRLTYHHIVEDYYKKVDPQALLLGARDGILTLLKLKGFSQAKLPGIAVGANDAESITHLVNLLNESVTRYGTKVAKTQLLYAELAGLAASVHDRYTLFLTPDARVSLNESLDGGNFSGVGLSIDLDPVSRYLRINEVIPGGPAMKAGVHDDDLIIQIDGFSTQGKSVFLDSKLLRGKIGTQVRLKIIRSGKVLPTPTIVTRAIIHDPSVISKMLPGSLGYVRLSVFGETTRNELTAALTKLDQKGARAFILDLRDNGGGYLIAAVGVSSNFVPSGAIVSVEDRAGIDTQYNADGTALRPRPLAVLVNRWTASASEITSGAIQDHKVGVLVGTRTFGKGVVQTIFPFADGSAIKVTTQHYYTPRGRDINKVGIQPDIISTLKPNVRFGDSVQDTQLATAVKYVQGRLTAQNLAK